VISVEPVNFDAGAVQYEWYRDDILLDGVAGAEAEISEPGEYRVTVENNGCFGENTMTVDLNDNPFTVEVEAGCVNFDYIIAVTNMDEIGEGAIVWSGPENFVAYEPSVNITGGATGEYIVTVTNAEGCPVTASVIVDNTGCAIPRGISPNGDGDNDSFDLSNLDVREIQIFNRYGLEVYHAEGYIDEWHGQSDKGDLPAATYFYMITLSAGKQVTGWVYLQREM
jgi:gliding motility-associated-like protein